MAKFMDVDSGSFGVTAAQLADAHRRDLEIQDTEGVNYEYACLDPEAGKRRRCGRSASTRPSTRLRSC